MMARERIQQTIDSLLDEAVAAISFFRSCVGVKDAACVDVCPVDCIYTRDEDDIYYISPDECIDCAACEPVCPVTAIFVEDAVPTQWASYTAMNYDYFKDADPSTLKRK